MFESTLRIDQESAYAELTRGYDVRAEMWCNNHCDLLHVTGQDVDAATEEIAETVGINDIVRRDEEAVLVTETCLLDHHDDLLWSYLRRHDCISLPPLTYDHGALLARIVSLDESRLTRVYNDLNESHDVQVEAKREIEAVVPDVPLLMLDSALPDLSPGQTEAITLAVERGYYEIPRDTTTQEIADDLDVTRRTFEEHLRRAENKLVKNVIDYLAV